MLSIFLLTSADAKLRWFYSRVLYSLAFLVLVLSLVTWCKTLMCACMWFVWSLWFKFQRVQRVGGYLVNRLEPSDVVVRVADDVDVESIRDARRARVVAARRVARDAGNVTRKRETNDEGEDPEVVRHLAGFTTRWEMEPLKLATGRWETIFIKADILSVKWCRLFNLRPNNILSIELHSYGGDPIAITSTETFTVYVKVQHLWLAKRFLSTYIPRKIWFEPVTVRFVVHCQTTPAAFNYMFNSITDFLLREFNPFRSRNIRIGQSSN